LGNSIYLSFSEAQKEEVMRRVKLPPNWREENFFALFNSQAGRSYVLRQLELPPEEPPELEEWDSQKQSGFLVFKDLSAWKVSENENKIWLNVQEMTASFFNSNWSDLDPLVQKLLIRLYGKNSQFLSKKIHGYPVENRPTVQKNEAPQERIPVLIEKDPANNGVYYIYTIKDGGSTYFDRCTSREEAFEMVKKYFPNAQITEK
jgi:hypothetical protein